LKAHHLYKVDVNYVIKEGKIVIVDEFTGRLMEGRQWSDGLHQAVEAKEGVRIKEETQTLATITLQNYFKLYDKICGMTGTAMTEANEFAKIYDLEVVAIPTNRNMQRIQSPDVIFATEKFKWRAVADEVEAYNKWDVVRLKTGEIYTGAIKSENDGKVVLAAAENGALQEFERSKLELVQRRGRPILVGTVSIEKSELLSSMLERRGIEHQVLNAKNHKREAEIIAQAGRRGAVTIATNMAGRGTDIILGGNPETMAWAMLQDKYETRLDVPHEEWTQLVHQIEQKHQMKVEGELVKQLGGLHVIGTERHESRRIDLQLRGRCGRQGDPGSSRFYLSFDDDLIRVFAGPVMRRIMEMGGFKDDVPIESRMVSRRIDGAQKKREEFNFEIRKNLLEYDEVMDEQRKRIYGFRQKILDGASCREIILDMVRDQVDTNLKSFLSPDFGCESFASFAGSKLGCELEPRSFRRLNFDEADKIAHEDAFGAAETEILGKVDENLPTTEDEAEWNWGALANFANLRWQLGVRDSELKKVGRDRVDEYLLEKARDAIRKVVLDEAAVMLKPDFGIRTALAWARSKFALELNPADFTPEMSAEDVRRIVTESALRRYDEKEAEFPVMAGFYRFDLSTPASPKLDREGLARWASQRFDAEFSVEHFNQIQRDDIRQLLVETSRRKQAAAQDTLVTLGEKLDNLARSGNVPLKGANGAAGDLHGWFRENVRTELPLERVENLEAGELREQLEALVEDHYHPEIRRMERMVLLDVVDSAWKDHLLAMDYLRSAVGHRGMAALDPKVEYKREGMRMFESLWQSINERVTDLVFRMELINEGAVRETFVETKAVHAAAPEVQPVGDFAETQQEAINQSGGAAAVTETIRNRGEKVGRNDPCPCGSGKKYKSCCMRGG
jgi:preprotein translocase subunit SecA